MKLLDQIVKVFRGQPVVYEQESGWIMPDNITAIKAYNKIAVATQCIDLIVSLASLIELDTYEKNKQYVKANASKLELFLDFPNPYQTKNEFFQQLYLYQYLYGMAIVVLENDGFYNLRPDLCTIEPDPKNYLKRVVFGTGSNSVVYEPSEVVLIKFPTMESSYKGKGVLEKLSNEINLVNKMLAYHDNVLKTGGVHKFVFKTDNVLGEKIKNRIREEWVKFHSITSKSSGIPPILEGGINLEKINITMNDLDFNESLIRLEKEIATSLGVPYELLNPTGNTNTDRLLKLLYITTILPLVENACASLTQLVNKNAAFFRLGTRKKPIYIRPELKSVLALREDVAKIAKAAQALYVSGIISKNEARVANGFPEIPDGDEFLHPANIAGSNLNPSQGGRPEKDDEKELRNG